MLLVARVRALLHLSEQEFSFCPSGEGDAGLKDLSDPCWSAESMQSHCACRVLANHSSAQEKAKRPVGEAAESDRDRALLSVALQGLQGL